VVVVVAMAEKKKPGKKVASIRHTFGRNSGSNHPIAQNISARDIDDVERETEYFVDLTNSGRSGVDFSRIDPFIVTTHTSKTAFTIPIDIIREYDILPGHNVTIKIYEVEEVKTESAEFVDDSNVIGRPKVMSDNTSADGCSSRLIDSRAYDYIGEDAISLTFRNLKNDKQTTASGITRNEHDNGFTFPINVRKEIDASPKDLIEIIDADHGKEYQSKEHRQSEKIDAMYEMISELYDAYTVAKND